MTQYGNNQKAVNKLSAQNVEVESRTKKVQSPLNTGTRILRTLVCDFGVRIN